MDFRTVISNLISRFQDQSVAYGLMGGFALGLWGVGRATIDIDFLVARQDLARIDTIMEELGYRLEYRTENVSQYRSPIAAFGEVDMIHAFREVSMAMLSRAVERDIYGGTAKIRVLLPEDIIGLKIQAIKNNPKRKDTDLAGLSPAAEREFQELALSDALRRDLDHVRSNRRHPFIKDGCIDSDAFLAFVQEFNEFTGHCARPFQPISDRDMRL
ncbi:MAG: hypothetical protein M0042_05570 [Nitrospiraceae bacterium]|nr:hypothetical protein [Nitrospiraceae bacterium]